jgi:hypothetical protein
MASGSFLHDEMSRNFASDFQEVLKDHPQRSGRYHSHSPRSHTWATIPIAILPRDSCKAARDAKENSKECTISKKQKERNQAQSRTHHPPRSKSDRLRCLLLPAYTIMVNGGNLLPYRGSAVSLRPDYRVGLQE